MRSLHRFLFGCATLTFALALTGGCTPKTREASNPTTKGTSAPAHAHPTKGPHGGPLAEFRSSGEEEFHAEIVIDRGDKKVTVYILDDDAKDPVAIDREGMVLNIKAPAVKQIKLTAQPQEKDPDKKSSRFVATDDLFGGKEKVQGLVVGTIDGKRYDGDFAVTPKK